MRNSAIDNASQTVSSPALVELLSALDRIEAIQSLEQQRLRLLTEREALIRGDSTLPLRTPDIVIALPRAA